ncbi:hypothetical protein ACOMHN_056580 [Nucella lapillus]
MADFFMGVYLAIVGIADRIYYGTYEWNDGQWKHTVACRMAGFLSILSSQVSAFIIGFITLESFLRVLYPHKHLGFTPKSAAIACITGWVVGVLFAAIPLLPFTPPWDFYGRVLIFWSIRSQTQTVSFSSNKAKAVTIGGHVRVVILSDLLCWFCVGLLALLALSGASVSGSVTVAVAIFVLPLNSALNPFLHTFLSLVERHCMARFQRQTEEESESTCRNCPNCARYIQGKSVNNLYLTQRGQPKASLILSAKDQEKLNLIEAFLRKCLMTPERVHLRDHNRKLPSS